MPSRAIIGASIASIAGALAWALISYKGGMEVGWIAWGIGGVVGFGGAALGGRGFSSGAICAVLAVLSILGGKTFAAQLAVGDYVDELVEKNLTRATYKENLADAEAFREVTSEDDYPAFMVKQGYVEHEALLSEDQLSYFKDEIAFELMDIAENSPTFADWKAERAPKWRDDTMSTVSSFELLKSQLSFFDFLWIFLGVGTAFKVGLGRDD